MRHFAWVVFAICCAAPVGADEVSVFTPSRSGAAPIYMNGRLVRIDRAAGTITLRTDRGLTVLNVDRQTLGNLGQVRPGSDLILGVNVSGTGASERRIVTDVRGVGVTGAARGRVTASSTGSGVTIVPSKQPALGTTTSTPRLSTTGSGSEISMAPRADGTSVPNANGTFTNDSLPRAPGLPPSPSDGINRNPASTGVQPVPGAQPLPGVQGPTGVQPAVGAQPLPGSQSTSGQQVPGAQPLPGTGVTGQSAVNPGLQTQPVPGTPGQSGINTGMVGQPVNPGMVPQPVPGTGTQSGVNTGGVATTGVGGLPASNGGVATAGVGGTAPAGGGNTAGSSGRGGSTGATGGGSPVLGPSVPQLGGVGAVGGINSQIPSIPPPSAGTMNAPILPVPSIVPDPNVPQTPAQTAMVRDMASRDFDMSVAVVAARAAEVDRAWVVYRSQCVTTSAPLNNRPREWFAVLDGSLTAPTEDLCESSFNEVARAAQGIEASLETARDAARRADVLPGRMREVLQRYNLDL